VPTSLEVRALDAILEAALIDSKDDNGDPVFHDVDASCLTQFTDKAALSDVFENLARQGFIACSGMEDVDGNEVAEYVSITPDGLEALKAAKAMN
jgi:hypothetical protein